MMQRMIPILMMVALAALLLVGCNAIAPESEPKPTVNGLHCLDSQDGSHPGFERLVKSGLENPSSMRTVWTKVGGASAGGNKALIMEFTARDGGRRMTHIAKGYFNNSTCRATLIRVN